MKKVIITSCISISLLFGACSNTVNSTNESEDKRFFAYELDFLPNGTIVDFTDKGRIYYKVKGSDKVKRGANIRDCNFIYLDEGGSYLEIADDEYCTFYINLNQQ